MNCGLGNRDLLRKHLLPKSLAGDTSFDGRITNIGLGVAGMFDRYCNRTLAYGEGVTEIFRGNRSHWYVSRYPVSAWTKVELRFFKQDNWTDISGQPISGNEESGLLHFGYTLGTDPIQVRVTWSGGYWFEQLEPEDDGYPSAAPASVTNNTLLEPAKFALPPELKMAWLLQCERVWDASDVLGTGMVDKPETESQLAELKLAPAVKEILDRYKRYAIS